MEELLAPTIICWPTVGLNHHRHHHPEEGYDMAFALSLSRTKPIPDTYYRSMIDTSIPATVPG